MSLADIVEKDFQDAQLGRGTRYLTIEEATALLDHCARIDWAFQFMESYECIDEREQARIDLSLLGLTQAQKLANSASELTQVSRDRLAECRAEPNPIIFQVWVDTAKSIIAKRDRARVKP